MIENYNGDPDELHARLIADYTATNPTPPDRWEWSHYLEAVQDSIESGNCWKVGDSVVAVNDNTLFYASCTGLPQADFLLTLYVLKKYEDLRIAPLGNDYMGLHHYFNSVSLRKHQRGQVAVIRTDIERYDALDVAVYIHG